MLTRLRVSLCSVLLLAGLVGCGGGSSSSSSSSTSPSQVSVAITPEQSLQTVLRPQTFRAAVKGAANQAVTWSLVSGGGSIDATTGLYVAGPTPGPAIVKATSLAHPSVSATQAVTLVAAPTIGGFTTSSAVIPYGGSANLTPTFTTDGTAVVTPSIGGSITSGSVYPVSPMAITSYTLTVTNSAGTSVAAAVTVNVQTAQVSIAPAAVTMTASTTQKFSAVVGGAVNTGVTWTATGGSVNTSGTYTAPSTPGDYAVVATATADASKSVLAAVHVVAAPAISSFTASKATISQGSGTVLNYTFSGGTGIVDQGVGTVVSTGTANVAPASTEKYTLTVTNAAGASVSSAATITVVPPPEATITLGPTVLGNGVLPSNTTGFTASVPIQAGVAYTWTISGTGATVTSGGTTNKVTFASRGGENPVTLTCSVLNGAGDTATGSMPLQVQRHWRSAVAGPVTSWELFKNTSFDMAVDNSSYAWLAWKQYDASTSGATAGIYVSRQTSYTAWTTPVRVNSDSVAWSSLGYASIATDNHGDAMVVWFEQDPGNGYQIWGSYFNGSAWSTALRLDGGTATTTAEYPSVAMDGSGNAFIIWDMTGTGGPAALMAARYSGGSVSAPVQIDADSGTNIVTLLDHNLAVDPNGGAIAVWGQYDSGALENNYYCSTYSGGSWHLNPRLSQIASSVGDLQPMVTTNGQGLALAAFGDYNSVTKVLSVATETIPVDGIGLPGAENPALTFNESGVTPLMPSLVGLNFNAAGNAVLGSSNTDFSMSVTRVDPLTGHWSYPVDPGLYSPLGKDNSLIGTALSAAGSAPVVWLDQATGELLSSSYDSILGAWTQSVNFPNGSLLPDYYKVKTSPNGLISMMGVLYFDQNGGHFYTYQYN